jgi:hypothetical protein
LEYLNLSCQAEWEDLVQCPQPTLLSHPKHLSQVQAAQIGKNAIGRTTPTIHVRRQAVQAEFGRDPLANLLDGLPGLDADEIAAMIRDLPMPNAVEVPGLTVEEAIEV